MPQDALQFVQTRQKVWPLPPGGVREMPSEDQRHPLPHPEPAPEAGGGRDKHLLEAGDCGDGVRGLQAHHDRPHQTGGARQGQGEEGVDDELSGDE